MTAIVKWVELPNSVRLPYTERGDLSGTPLLLLHGFADSLRSFELVLPHLPVFIRAIALTQRGHGDASRPTTGYRVSDFAADLAAFMDALHLEVAFIAGASFGGLVAQRFAMDHPERVLGLALIGSPVTLAGKPQVREAWDSTISKVSDPIDPEFVRRFVANTVAPTAPQSFVEILVQESLKVPASVWKAAATEGFLKNDFTAELHKVKAPTLIIWGDRDTLTQDDQGTLLTAITNSRRVVYDGGGHTLIAEEPERIAADLATFVRSIISR